MNKKKTAATPAALSLAGKIGFVVIIALLAAGGVYLGLRMAGGTSVFSHGAKFDDLPEDLRTRIAGLAAAVKEKPRELTIRSTFCHSLLEGRLLDDAEDCYKEILKIDKASPDAYTHLGEAAFYRGDNDKALAYYDRAVAIAPDYAHVYFNIGYLRMKNLNDYQGAREAFRKYLQLVPESTIKFQVSYLIQQLNDKIGDAPGVPKKGKELVINPNELMNTLKQQ